jgi:hypothetical protein
MKTVLQVGGLLAFGISQWTCCSCPNATSPTAAASAPAASPTPSPSPSVGATCKLPPVNVDAPSCRPEPPPKFEDAVVRAQDQVRREHPELFDGSGLVISQQSYTGWVATTLRSYGLCAAAVGGAGDEVGVKDTNDYDEQYDIVTGAMETWTAYQVTCRPPLF